MSQEGHQSSFWVRCSIRVRNRGNFTENRNVSPHMPRGLAHAICRIRQKHVKSVCRPIKLRYHIYKLSKPK